MPELPGAGRLESETLAAYIDGLLPPEERARVEAEIAADPETYEWVVNTVRAVEDETLAPPVAGSAPAGVPGGGAGGASEVERGLPNNPERGRVLPFYRRRWFVGGAGTVLTAAAALLLVVRVQPEWWQRMRGPQVDPRLAKLVEAVGEERYLEARLTGGFKYGPLRQSLRGPRDLSSQNLRILAAAEASQKTAANDPSADNLLVWGVAQALLGDAAGAVSALESALDASRDRPDIAASLAGALITLGDQSSEPSAFLRAIEVTAPWDQTDNPELLYNRALALERMRLTEGAVSSWDKYLALDDSAEWKSEARRRRAALKAQFRSSELRGADAATGRAGEVAATRHGLHRTLERVLIKGRHQRVDDNDVVLARTLVRDVTTCQVIGSSGTTSPICPVSTEYPSALLRASAHPRPRGLAELAG